MKKTLSLFLSLVMLLSITAGLSFNAYATVSGVAYTVPDSLTPVIGNTASVSTSDISVATTGSISGTYSVTSVEYQYKKGSSWSKVYASEKFEPGKIYRLKISSKSTLQNNDTHDEDLVCKINGATVTTKSEGDLPDATSDFYYITRTTGPPVLNTGISVFHYYGMLTQDVNTINITAPTFELGQELAVNPYAYKIDSNFSFKNIAIEVQDGSDWKTATKYECNTKYRYVIDISATDGYLFKKPINLYFNSGLFVVQSNVASDRKSCTIYHEFPAGTPKAHKYGTEGDARFTCTVCNKVDEEKKAEAAAEDALADAKAQFATLPAADKVTLEDKDKIEAARKAYDALTDAQKAAISSVDYQKLLDAEKALAALTPEDTTAPEEGVIAPVEENPYTLTFGKIKKIKKSAKKTVIKVTLKKNGKALKKKKVTLKIAGKKYTVKTNKKGVAKFTIKKAALKKLKVGKKAKLVANYGKKIKVTKKVKVVK